MVRLIVIGDTHFKRNNKQDTDIMCDSILKKLEEYKPDAVVILGDIFDRHSEVNIGALRRGSNFIFDIMENYHVYILVGNHDIEKNNMFFPKDNSLYSFKKYEGITIIDRTKKVNIQGVNLVFVPYVPPGRFFEALDFVDDWKNADMIFAHQEIKGSMVTARRMSTIGDGWLEEYPWLVSGHLHERHKVGNNVYYPGSPQQVKIDDDENRYIARVDFGDKIKITKIRVRSLVKRQINLRISDMKNYVPEDNVKLKINIIGTQDDYHKLASKTDIIDKWKGMGIKVFTDIKVNKKTIINQEEVRKTYRDIVSDKIGEDEELKSLYEKLIVGI